MRATNCVRICAALVACSLALSGNAFAAARGDDYAITLTTATDIATRRAQLITHIWGSGGFPTTASTLVSSSVVDPSANPNDPVALDNLDRVEKLKTVIPRANGAAAVEVSTFHLIPVRKRNRLVVVVHGHGCHGDFYDGNGGLANSIRTLVRDGYGVAAILMPSNEQCSITHDSLYTESLPLRYFLEPTAKTLNYIAQNYPAYRQFNMIGLSGGGWTTTVYAAVDARIKTSIPVAGSIPLYLRHSQYNDDIEQYDPSFYGIAGLPDLYVMASAGPGRRQIQVLNLNDECCFGANQHQPAQLPLVPDNESFATSVRAYESRVKTALRSVGGGSFRVEIDSGTHQISAYVIEAVIHRQLNAEEALKVVTPYVLD